MYRLKPLHGAQLAFCSQCTVPKHCTERSYHLCIEVPKHCTKCALCYDCIVSKHCTKHSVPSDLNMPFQTCVQSAACPRAA